jgi:DNA mismatch endonuclease (patch repair protein)
MARVPLKHSAPERALRAALTSAGFRFRLHLPDLPGRPDIANKRRKVAIFVDGCFWHGCPRHFRLPKTRTSFWEEKIRRNRLNRARHRTGYPPEWAVVEIFECEVRERPGEVFAEVIAAFARSPV